GCTGYDTCLIEVKAIPATDAGILPDVCWDAAPIQLTTSSGASPAGGTWSNPDNLNQGDILTPSAIGTAKKFVGEDIKLYYQTGLNGCQTRDSVILRVKALPQIDFPEDSFCMADGSIALDQFSTPGGPGSTWLGNGVSGSQ